MRVILAVLLASLLQDARDLKLSLPKDKPQRLRLTVFEDGVDTPRGKTEKNVDRGGFEFGLETQAPSGPDRFAVKLTILRMHRESRGRKMDSATPDADPNSGIMAKLVGTGLLFDLAPDGKVLGARGAEEMEADFARKLGLKPPDLGPHKGLVARFLPLLRENVERLFALYPSKAVLVGGVWSRKFSISVGYPHHAEAAWTLSARKDARAVLSGKWTHSAYPDSDKQGGELRIVHKMTGTGEGTVELDEATGWPLKASMTHQLAGSIGIDGLKAPLPSDTSDGTVKITLTVGPWDGK
jgi:hypothetical protein